MFGYLRFFLATNVLLSHLFVPSIGRFNIGVASVVSFYMLSGYVVTHLVSTVFRQEEGRIARFYIERLLRIYPLYLYILVLTILFTTITGYGSPTFNLFNVAYSILIIPLNYYMYIDSTILTSPRWWLIPMAWSLGAELQAYILLPYIASYRIKLLFSMISIIIFVLACGAIINTEYFAYRLFPGIFFVFILGGCIYKNTKSPHKSDAFDKLFPRMIFGLCILGLLGMGLLGRLYNTYLTEVFLAIIISIPIITILSNSTIRLPFNRLLGDMSYGVFLSHFLVMWFFEMYLVDYLPTYKLKIVTVFIISVIISFIGVTLIERPLWKYRIKLSN